MGCSFRRLLLDRAARCLALPLALLLLSGCGKPDTPDGGQGKGGTGPDKPASTTRQLTFWHIMNYSGPKEILAEAVQRFEQANPDTKVQIQTFENDAYKTKLAIEMTGGSPPDILFTWGGGPLAEMASAGKILDLTDALKKDGWEDRFIDQALDICTANGRVYAVPLDLSLVLLWYNRQLFEESGLAAPRMFDELLSLCTHFNQRKITPLALGNMKQWPGAFYFVYLATRAGGTPLFFDAAAGKPGASFADPAFVKAGESILEMISAQAFPVGFNGMDVGRARSRFLAGKAAMYLMGTWLVPRVKTEQPEFLDKLACMPFPSLPGGRGDPSTVVGGVNCGFAVSASTPYPDEAVELLRFLSAAEVARKWCEIGRIPALKVAATDEAKLPRPTRQALGYLKAAKRLQPYYDQYLPPRLAAEHKKTTQKLFAGTLSARDAAARMAARARNTE